MVLSQKFNLRHPLLFRNRGRAALAHREASLQDHAGIGGKPCAFLKLIGEITHRLFSALGIGGALPGAAQNAGKRVSDGSRKGVFLHHNSALAFLFGERSPSYTLIIKQNVSYKKDTFCFIEKNVVRLTAREIGDARRKTDFFPSKSVFFPFSFAKKHGILFSKPPPEKGEAR